MVSKRDPRELSGDGFVWSGWGATRSGSNFLSPLFNGKSLMAYRAVDHYVYDRVRSFLRRRHKVSSGGYTIFSDAVVFGQMGVLRLRDVHLGGTSASLR
jgi:hypothetical protein